MLSRSTKLALTNICSYNVQSCVFWCYISRKCLNIHLVCEFFIKLSSLSICFKNIAHTLVNMRWEKTHTHACHGHTLSLLILQKNNSHTHVSSTLGNLSPNVSNNKLYPTHNWWCWAPMNCEYHHWLQPMVFIG